MNKRKNLDIGYIGDEAVAKLSAEAGNPVGMIMIMHDPSNGEVTVVSNIDEDARDGLLNFLVRENAAGNFDEDPIKKVTVQ